MSGPHVTLDPDPLDAEDQERLRVEFFGLQSEAEHVADAYVAGMAYGRTIARTRKIAIALTWFCAGIIAATVVVGFAKAHDATRQEDGRGLVSSDDLRGMGSVVEGRDAGATPLRPGHDAAGGPIDGTRLPGRGDLGSSGDASLRGGDASPTPVTEPPAIAGGLASFCAPTPTHCQSWGGDAHLGAVPSFRYGDRPYRVTVCRQDHRSTCTTVTVVSFCACGRFLIDLSPAAFSELAPLSRGTVPVTISDAPSLTPPPTSTLP